MEKTIFMTGYPGFLATDLLTQLLDDHQQSIKHIYLLVLETEKEFAEEKLNYFLKKNQLQENLCSIVVGDITEQNLGLTSSYLDVTHVFHLASVYDLAVSKHIAEKVNVHGTKCVNHWVRTLPQLKRYIYFSTAYVSGEREGRIYEHELIVGQTFRNYYELTKFEAEVQVEQMKQFVPVTIIRPGVVKGHSQTGKTMKFDGLYFLLNFYDTLQALPIIPYLKNGDRQPPEGNFIPSDYLIRATSFLAMDEKGEGKTYHLTDPNPYNMMELQKILSEHYLGKLPKGKLDITAAKLCLQSSTMQQILGVEIEALDYFIYQSSYDTSQAESDLSDTDIRCPDLLDTIPAMVDYYRKYKDDYKKQIQIM